MLPMHVTYILMCLTVFFNKIIQSVQKYLCIFVLNVKITVKYMV